MIDREKVFRLLQNKDWFKLIDLFEDNQKVEFINEDTILKKILEDNFINELVNGDSLNSNPAYLECLEKFYKIHLGEKKIFSLNENDYKNLVINLSKENDRRGNISKACKYANEFPEDEFCIIVIDKYNNEKSKNINHAQENSIKLTQTNESRLVDNTISVFKSKQEYDFYKGASEVFSDFMVLPNVAMSSVLSWENLKESLSQRERDYFFKSLIDCVIIDPNKDYKPSKFIELDSSFHDIKTQIDKDEMKDKIISLAGHKLFRIRSKGEKITKDNFKILIREAISKY